LGDAASGVYSKLGQGCAFALWSANLLAETLLHSQPQEAQPLQTFSVQSKRQGHSLADLNLLAHLDYSPWLARLKLYNFFEMSKIVNDPEWSYADLLRKYRWQVAVAKIHWRFTRKFVSE
jgi:2-polyprenyl-6-methoxyphenol hydroxylase-like FAD-dependent oxidoreductase